MQTFTIFGAKIVTDSEAELIFETTWITRWIVYFSLFLVISLGLGMTLPILFSPYATFNFVFKLSMIGVIPSLIIATFAPVKKQLIFDGTTKQVTFLSTYLIKWFRSRGRRTYAGHLFSYPNFGSVVLNRQLIYMESEPVKKIEIYVWGQTQKSMQGLRSKIARLAGIREPEPAQVPKEAVLNALEVYSSEVVFEEPSETASD